MRFSLISAVVLLLAASAFARIINVPADYATIQAGIDASINGDTVLVGPGTYTEILTIPGQSIMLASADGPYETTIEGRLIIRNFADTIGSTIEGFTIFGQSNDPNHGSLGITIISGTAQIIGNIIKHHYSNASGGIYSGHRPVIIKYNIIEDNYGMAMGGGIYLDNVPDGEISNNIIRNNRSGYGMDLIGNGAGILCVGKVRIFYNLIYGNSVRCYSYPGPPPCGEGGGIYADASAQIFNNTIVNNTAIRNNNEGDGGGIIVSHVMGDSLRIYNNIIASNSRGGLRIRFASPESLYDIPEGYNLLFGNAIYDISAPETSQTDIFADPMFTDSTNYDFSLQPGSPAIDAGDPSFPLDPDSTRVDIGALFFDQRVSIDDSARAIPVSFELHQNYPNPFNGQTIISYNLPTASRISCVIFDITGRIVKNLANGEYQDPGEHRFIWDGLDNSGKSISTAIYFYQLQIDENKIVKSMILIK